MLWSKSLVDADNKCPAQSVRLRSGEKGEGWGGFAVGSYVHDKIHSDLSGCDAPSREGLTVNELISADTLLSNFKKMEVPIPDQTESEQSYISPVDSDGVPGGWSKAPSWAVRGESWEPTKAKDTYFRIQPDAWFIDPNDRTTIVIYDWKTAWGMPSDSSLEKDTQAITYCAALCQMFPEVTGARFVWWNLRYKRGNMLERSAQEWIELATPIWRAISEKDQTDIATLEEDTRTGEHCGRCPYRSKCLTLGDGSEGMGDAALYRYSQRVGELGKLTKSSLTARLKQRTGVLELADGTSLGPMNKTYQRWESGKKPTAIRDVFNELITAGLDPFEYLDIKGSIGEWLSSLPEDVRSSADAYTTEFNRQTFIEKG
jgi:hypothetical protein